MLGNRHEFVRNLLGEDAGARGYVTNEGDVADALIGCGILDVQAYGQRPGLLRILFEVAGALQHLEVIGDRRRRFETNVITDLSNGRGEIALPLTRDDEFKDLATHGSENFSHGLPFRYEQLFVGYRRSEPKSNTCS